MFFYHYVPFNILTMYTYMGFVGLFGIGRARGIYTTPHFIALNYPILYSVYIFFFIFNIKFNDMCACRIKNIYYNVSYSLFLMFTKKQHQPHYCCSLNNNYVTTRIFFFLFHFQRRIITKPTKISRKITRTGNSQCGVCVCLNKLLI